MLCLLCVLPFQREAPFKGWHPDSYGFHLPVHRVLKTTLGSGCFLGICPDGNYRSGILCTTLPEGGTSCRYRFVVPLVKLKYLTSNLIAYFKEALSRLAVCFGGLAENRHTDSAVKLFIVGF